MKEDNLDFDTDNSAEGILKYMGRLFIYYLDELAELPLYAQNLEFNIGQKTTLVECLEIIQQWEHAKENHLDFEIEKVYPLI